MARADVVGAALAVLSAIVSNLGVNIQKYSHVQNGMLSVNDQQMYLRRPLWWFGLLCVVLGSVGDFAAFGFATQALVAALGGGTTIVANVVIAHYFNREQIYWVRCLVLSMTSRRISWASSLSSQALWSSRSSQNPMPY